MNSIERIKKFTNLSFAAIKAQFISELQANNLWSNNDRVFLFADNADPLIDITGNGSSATAIGTPYQTAGRGVYQTDDASYYNLNYNPAVNGVNYTLTDASLVTFWLDDMQIGNGIGYFQPGSSSLALVQDTTANIIRVLCNNTNSGDTFTYTGSLNGVHITNRKGTSLTYWINGTKLSTKTNTATTITNGLLYALATKASSGIGTPTPNRLGLVMIRAGMTDTECQTLSTIITNCFTKYKATKPFEIFKNNYLEYYALGSKLIHDQVGNMAFSAFRGQIHFSTDNKKTWTSLTVSYAGNVEFAHIFANGNVLFATPNQLYWWTNKAVAPATVTVKDRNNNNYTPHTPVNNNYKGSYFKRSQKITPITQGGKEMIVWGNYANVNLGAAPVNLYHAYDDGTVKVDYTFGQNQYFTDNGTTSGGTGGNLLGDASNPLKVRHVHCTAYDSGTGKWWACTGDWDRTSDGFTEVNWLSGIYDSINDRIDWSFEFAGSDASHTKAIGLYIVGTDFIWGSDQTVGTDHLGIYKSPISGVANIANHVRLKNLSFQLVDMSINGNNIIAVGNRTRNITISKDGGSTWDTIAINKITSTTNMARGLREDSDGFTNVAGDDVYYNYANGTYRTIFLRITS